MLREFGDGSAPPEGSFKLKVQKNGRLDFWKRWEHGAWSRDDGMAYSVKGREKEVSIAVGLHAHAMPRHQCS